MLTLFSLPTGARVGSTDGKGQVLGLIFDTAEHAVATLPRQRLHFLIGNGGILATGIGVDRLLSHDEDAAAGRAAVAAWKEAA